MRFFKCFSHSDCQYVTMNLSVIIALQCLGQASYRLHTSYRPIPLYLQKYSGNKNNKKATSPQFSPLSSENLLSLTDWQAFLRIWFLRCFMKYLWKRLSRYTQTLSQCPILWQLNPMLFFFIILWDKFIIFPIFPIWLVFTGKKKVIPV